LYRGVESHQEPVPSTIVYIDLLRPDSPINLNSPLTSWTSPSQAAEERSLVERGYRIVRAAQYPRHICDVDPTITLLSHSMINARTYFTVYSEDRLIFSKSTILEPVEPTTSHVDGILHQTSLVPGLWDTMVHLAKLRYGYQIPRRCLSSKYMAIDASRYTIMQRVVQDPSSSSSPHVVSELLSPVSSFNGIDILSYVSGHKRH